ncbi:MAG: hypothetical protein P8Y66_11505 [Nitrospirota bacterium]|jgi:uncharacterized membrane protein HdeD (DUF308 family)
MNRIAIVLGIPLIVLGIMIIRDPVLHDPLLYQQDFDLRGYNIPFGIFMIAVGMGFVWTSWTSRKKKR